MKPDRPSDEHEIAARARKALSFLLTFLGAVLWHNGTANAQTVDAQPIASTQVPPPKQLEEIVVTARRRGEAIERVPVSVTAFSAKDLEKRSITSESDLQTSVPGLTVRTGQNANYVNFSIRGQSLDLFAGSRPAVLPYINDVQITTFGTSTFFDLDSIQTLKGPQGTLFGRNTTGGAVLFTTAKPTNDFGGFVEGRLGDYDLEELQGALNIPIVEDKVLLRVATDLMHRDGYQENILLNTDLGRIERETGRMSLTLRPTDDLQNTLVVQYSHSGGNNVMLETASVYPCGATNNGVALATTAGCLYGPALDRSIGLPGAYDAYRAIHPGTQAGGIQQEVAIQKALGPWQVNSYNPSQHKENDWYATNSTTYTLSPDMQIRNIFGLARAESHDEYDAQGTGPYFIQSQTSGTGSSPSLDYTGDTGVTNKTFQWSEEPQLSGEALNHTLKYIFGGYFSHERDTFYAPVAFVEVLPFIPKTVEFDDFRLLDDTQAVYFQGTQDLSSLTKIQGLSFTGGFRYTWEQVGLDQGPRSTQLMIGGVPQESLAFRDPSWTVGLEYQATSDLLLYVTQRGSWRSGGLNGTGPARKASAAEGGNILDSETTTDVEAGAKYRGDLEDVPFTANVAFYNQWIDNVQRVVYATPPAKYAIGGAPSLEALTVNIPKAEVSGFELDTNVNPTSWLEIGGNLAYTFARYTQGTSVLFGQGITYGPYADTPRWAGTVYAEATLPTPEEWGAMSLRGDVYMQTGQYYSNLAATLAPDTRIPGYALTNFHYDWRGIYGSQFTLSAFVKNAFNRDYYTGGIALGEVFGQNGVIPGEPRTFGFEMRYSF